MTVGENGESVEAVPPPLVVDEHWCPGCAALGRRRKNQGKEEPEPGVTLGFAPNVTAEHSHGEGDG